MESPETLATLIKEDTRRRQA